jgi:hypothetical protein
MAGELWLLLSQISSKSKQLNKAIPKMEISDDRDMIEDFAESAVRLMDKFQTLFREAEVNALREYKAVKARASSRPRNANRQGDGLRSQTEIDNLASRSPTAESDTGKFPSAQMGRRDRALSIKLIEKISRGQVGNAGDQTDSVLATEIINSLFGTEHQLSKTEKLIATLWLWYMRCDASYEEVIRRFSTSATVIVHYPKQERLPELKYPSIAKQAKNSGGLSLEETWDGEIPATVTGKSESGEESEEPISKAESKASVNPTIKPPAMSRSPGIKDEQQEGTHQRADPTSPYQVSAARSEGTTSTANTQMKSESWGTSRNYWAVGWDAHIKKKRKTKQAEVDGKGKMIDDGRDSIMPTMRKKNRYEHDLERLWSNPITSETNEMTTENRPKLETTPRAEFEPRVPSPVIRTRVMAPEPPKFYLEQEHAITTASGDRESKNDQTRNLTRRIPRTEALYLVDSTMEYLGKMHLESLPEMTEDED